MCRTLALLTLVTAFSSTAFAQNSNERILVTSQDQLRERLSYLQRCGAAPSFSSPSQAHGEWMRCARSVDAYNRDVFEHNALVRQLRREAKRALQAAQNEVLDQVLPTDISNARKSWQSFNDTLTRGSQIFSSDPQTRANGVIDGALDFNESRNPVAGRITRDQINRVRAIQRDALDSLNKIFADFGIVVQTNKVRNSLSENWSNTHRYATQRIAKIKSDRQQAAARERQRIEERKRQQALAKQRREQQQRSYERAQREAEIAAAEARWQAEQRAIDEEYRREQQERQDQLNQAMQSLGAAFGQALGAKYGTTPPPTSWQNGGQSSTSPQSQRRCPPGWCCSGDGRPIVPKSNEPGSSCQGS